MQICPQCGTHFDWNDSDSSYQVNDYFELIFCEYDCSAAYAFDHIRKNIETIKMDEIRQLIETV